LILRKDDDENKENLLKIAGKLKVALKGFLKSGFKWERLAIGIANGEWRTRQFLVSKEVREKLKKDKDSASKKVLEKKGCKVHIA
jgi:hypothetical protein